MDKWNLKLKTTFTLAPPKMKNLSIHLTKRILQLYMREETKLLKEIKELRKWRGVPCLWTGRLGVIRSSVLRHRVCISSVTSTLSDLCLGRHEAASQSRPHCHLLIQPWALPRGPGGSQRPVWWGLSPGKGASCGAQPSWARPSPPVGSWTCIPSPGTTGKGPLGFRETTFPSQT